MPREELCNGLRRYVVALKYVQLKQIGTIPVVSIQRDKKLKHSIHHITYLANQSKLCPVTEVAARSSRCNSVQWAVIPLIPSSVNADNP